MNIAILHEDDSVLVINKPPGVIVNRADTVRTETVQDWAQERLGAILTQMPQKEEHKDFYLRAGIVHRIDKETSGCLVIARTPEAFVELQRQFKEREIKKTYLAIVHGALVPPESEIRAPVGRLPWNREHFGIVPGGKDAVTRYKVIKSWQATQGREKEEVTLVELYPETGRTHQIRVHMKYINHPLVGDYLYAGRKTARDDRTWAPRVMLHASKIVLIHPDTHEPLTIEAPVPRDMMDLIQP